MKKNEKALSEELRIKDFLMTFKAIECHDSTCSNDHCVFYHQEY